MSSENCEIGSMSDETIQNQTSSCRKDLMRNIKVKKDLKLQEDKKSRKSKTYHWGPTQQQKYINFLAQKRDLFEMDSNKRRSVGIHVKMSKFIRNRNPTQCRSHNQKMLMKYKTIDEIILWHQYLLKPKNKENNVKGKQQNNKTEDKPEEYKLVELFTLDTLSGNFYQDYFRLEMKEVQSEQVVMSDQYDIY